MGAKTEHRNIRSLFDIHIYEYILRWIRVRNVHQVSQLLLALKRDGSRGRGQHFLGIRKKIRLQLESFKWVVPGQKQTQKLSQKLEPNFPTQAKSRAETSPKV